MGYIIEIILFVWFVVGQTLYYVDSNCSLDAPTLESLLINIIVLLYVRLLRIITLALFVVLCGPVYLIMTYFSPPDERPQPASQDLLKSLNKVQFKTLMQMRNEYNYKHASTSIPSTPTGADQESNTNENNDHTTQE